MPKKRFNLPPLDLIQGFEAAARNLSFTKAAEELFITQSAVSRQIRGLEEHLGIALFERRHRALALTEEGRALYSARSAGVVAKSGLRNPRVAIDVRSARVMNPTPGIARHRL